MATSRFLRPLAVIAEYTPGAISDAFAAIRNKFPSPSADVNGRLLRVAIFNAARGVFKPFLDVTHQDVRETLDVNVTTAFTFARESILDFKRNDIANCADGKRGTMIFAGATAALRRNGMTSVSAYLYLVNQDRSAWTWELDCTPLCARPGTISSGTSTSSLLAYAISRSTRCSPTPTLFTTNSVHALVLNI
ncbi:hypothetical protein BDN71DRAFT_1436883 [Pleurotus eryngii]|uniref:Uncharacterized protein n=1 Tax=Pleurotus eryngii TaxID=5323 RepID=A0A9P5ZIV1_PLEER|nr:hypothetical protein BDN71DRAFT_1436883 [Pleurotus eryngii]